MSKFPGPPPAFIIEYEYKRQREPPGPIRAWPKTNANELTGWELIEAKEGDRLPTWRKVRSKRKNPKFTKYVNKLANATLAGTILSGNHNSNNGEQSNNNMEELSAAIGALGMSGKGRRKTHRRRTTRRRRTHRRN
jgi:hypothetical protein